MEAKSYVITYAFPGKVVRRSSKVFRGIKVALSHAKHQAEQGATMVYIHGYDFAGHQVMQERLNLETLKKHTYGNY